MNILLTGFEPFGGETINPSWEAVRRGKQVPGATFKRLRLPVEWDEGQELLTQAIRDLRPDCVLMCGQAGGRAGISIERVAVNLMEAGAPDNAGVAHAGDPIEPEGPGGYLATYPYRAMLAALKDADIPAAYSFTAGAYLCNCVMYRALHLAATEFPGMRAGFIHLPFLPEQTQDKPSLPLETMVRAIELCLRAIAEDEKEE